MARDLNFQMNRYRNLNKSINIVNDAQPVILLKEHWSSYELVVNDNASIRHFINFKNISQELIVYKKDERIDCNGLNLIKGDYIKSIPEKYMANYMDWAMRLCQKRSCDLLYINNFISMVDLKPFTDTKKYDSIFFVWPANTNDEALSQSKEIMKEYPNSEITIYSVENTLSTDITNFKPLKTQIEDSLGYSFASEKNEFVTRLKSPWVGKIYTTMSHWLWAYNFLLYKKWI